MKYKTLRWTICIALITAVILLTSWAANSQPIRFSGTIGSTVQNKIRPIGTAILSYEVRDYDKERQEEVYGHPSISAEVRSVIGNDQPTYFGSSVGYNLYLNSNVLVKPYVGYHYELRDMDSKSNNRGWQLSAGTSLIIGHLFLDAAYIRGFKVGIGVTGLL